MVSFTPMNDFIIKNSKNVFSPTVGLRWISRLSTIQVSRAQPIDWHSHDNVEILICHRGTLRYEFESHPPANLHPGCFLVIQPRLRHRVYDGIDGPVSRSSVFLKMPGRTTRVRDFFSTGEYREIIALLLEKRLRPERLPQGKERDLAALSTLIGKGKDLNDLEKLELRALVVSSVVGIAASRRGGADITAGTVIDKAMEWIDARLDRKFALDELIAYIGYGRSRFFALFRERTGLTPLEWTVRRRLEKAKVLLADRKMSVAETAHAVGFRSPVFFSKIFRTRIGLTPTAWQSQKAPRKPAGQATRTLSASCSPP